MTTALVRLNDGTDIPATGYGTASSFYLRDCSTVVQQALEAGYRHLDCAQNYGNQQHVRRGIMASRVPREELYLTTKIGDVGADPKNFVARKFFDECLAELHSDAITTDPVAAWKELEKIKKEGKARSIGVSNFTTKALEAVLGSCEIVPAFHSIEFNPYALTTYLPTLLPLCQKHDVVIGGYSSLLPLTRHKDGPVNSVVKRVVAERAMNETDAQVLLLWARQVAGGPIITASTDPTRMVEALKPFLTGYPNLCATHLEAITAAGAAAPHREWGSHWPFVMPGEGGIIACPPGITHQDVPEENLRYWRMVGKI